MSFEHRGITFDLAVNVERAIDNCKRVESLVFRTISLMRRIGLPENIDEAIAKVVHLAAVLNSLAAAMTAVQAASGPYGWAFAAVGLAATGISMWSFIDSVEIDFRTR